MTILERVKAAIVRFIGVEDDPHDCPDPLAEGCNPLGECPGSLHAAGIRGNYGQVRNFERLKILDHDGRGEQVVHRNIEEPLNLGGVQIQRHDAIRSGPFEQRSD